MFDLLVSARLFALLALLFVAPSVWDIFKHSSIDSRPAGFSIRCAACEPLPASCRCGNTEIKLGPFSLPFLLALKWVPMEVWIHMQQFFLCRFMQALAVRMFEPEQTHSCPLCRSYFQRNVRGEDISAQPSFAKRMVRAPQRRARAAIVVLARNGDCDDVLLSLARMEQRFNRKFNYPYVFLNNEEFDSSFRNRCGPCPLYTMW